MSGTARISDCGQYRYLLTRNIPARYWGTGDDAREVVFVMLNPSTADASIDDPTIRRCIGYAMDWGRTVLTVANLYALRSTDPKALWSHPDPVGPENDMALLELAQANRDLVCAWGSNAKPARVERFSELAELAGARLLCLGTTKGGDPRHPLYLRKDASPRPWPVSSENDSHE